MSQIALQPAEQPASGASGAIGAALSGLRQRIRSYVTLEGLLAIAVALGVAFWLTLAIDWFFEFSASIRVLTLVVAAVAILIVAYRRLVLRLAAPMSERSMALLLERKFHQLNDGLLTSVELGAAPERAALFNQQMLAHTRDTAAQTVRKVEVREVLAMRQMRRTGLMAAALVASIVLLGLMSKTALGMWWDRYALLSDNLWPRTVHLQVEGFKDGKEIVAEGGNFELRVSASSRELTPDRAYIDFEAEDGGSGRHNMVVLGNATSEGGEQRQQFTFTFSAVKSTQTFIIRAGDARSRELKLQVVPNPIVESLAIHCKFPAYIGRADQELQSRNLQPLPVGTQLTLVGKSNKELVSLDVYEPLSDQPQTPIATLLPGKGLGRYAPENSSFSLDLGKLSADRTLQLVLLDTDGIRSPEPVRIELLAKADEPPRVAVHREGVGTSVTAKCRAPLKGEVIDDYGVAKTQKSYTVDGAESPPEDFVAPVLVKHDTALHGEQAKTQLFEPKLAVDQVFDFEPLGVSAGQVLVLTIRAEDSYDNGPNIGNSDLLLFNIVTEEQLLEILAGRELSLRRRFEMAIKEMTDTRTSLAVLRPETDEPPAEAEVKPEGAQPDEAQPAAKPAEPAKFTPPTEEVLTAERLRVQRALQTARRNQDETAAIAQGFLGLREEVINNRVDSERHKTGLKENVADPLQEIADKLFPLLEAKLEALQAHLAEEVREKDLAGSLRDTDAIVARMLHILDQMQGEERFEEVIAELRLLQDTQKNVSQQTQEVHKSSTIKKIKDFGQ